MESLFFFVICATVALRKRALEKELQAKAAGELLRLISSGQSMKWGRAMAVARMARVAIADREGRVLVGSDQQFGSRGQVVSADYPGD